MHLYLLLHRYVIIDRLAAEESRSHVPYEHPFLCQTTEALSNPFDVNVVDSSLSASQGDFLKAFA